DKLPILNAGRDRTTIVIEGELRCLLGSNVKFFNKERCLFDVCCSVRLIEILVRLLKYLELFTGHMNERFRFALLLYFKAFNLFIGIENSSAFENGFVDDRIRLINFERICMKGITVTINYNGDAVVIVVSYLLCFVTLEGLPDLNKIF